MVDLNLSGGGFVSIVDVEVFKDVLVVVNLW